MSQRPTRKSIAEEILTPTKRQTRSSSVCSDISELDSTELSGRATRKSTRISAILNEVKPASPTRGRKSTAAIVNEDVSGVKVGGRTRTSSISSVLSDTSDISQLGSTRVTRKSSRLAQNDVNDTPEMKRSSSISSIISEVDATSTTDTVTTPALRSSRKSAQLAKEKLNETSTPRNKRGSSLTKDESGLGTPIITPSIKSNKLLELKQHQDSPYQNLEKKTLKRQSLTQEKEEGDDVGAGKPLFTTQYEQLDFSTDDENDVLASTTSNDRKRKSILPPKNKNETLITITEDEEIEDENVVAEKIKTPQQANKKTPQADEKKTPQSDNKKTPQLANQNTLQADSKKTPQQININEELKTTTNKTYTSPKKNRLLQEYCNAINNPSNQDEDKNNVTTTANNKQNNKRKSIENDTKTSATNEDKNIDDEVVDKKKRKSTPMKTTPNKNKQQSPKDNKIQYEEITLEGDDEDDKELEENNKQQEKRKSNTKTPQKDLVNTKKTPKKDTTTNKTPLKDNNIKTPHKDDNAKKTPQQISNNKSPKQQQQISNANNKVFENETPEDRIKRIKLEKLKLKLLKKKEKYLKKNKLRKRKEKLRKLKLKKLQEKEKNEDGVTTTPTKATKVEVIKKESNKDSIVNKTAKKGEKQSNDSGKVLDEQRLLKILEKKEMKKQLWLKKLAEKKLKKQMKKTEENEFNKNERRIFFHQRLEVKKKEQEKFVNKKLKKKNKQKKKMLNNAEKSISGSVDATKNDGKVHIELSDIIGRLNEITKSGKAVKRETVGVRGGGKENIGGGDENENLRGKPKSGRFWKETKNKFSSTVKTPGLRRPHVEKEKLRQEIQKNKELTRHILDEQAKAKEEHRLRRIENIKRRDENAKKAEIVQVIKNPAKLKRMKKKQLRMIEKRDTLPIIEKKKQKESQSTV